MLDGLWTLEYDRNSGDVRRYDLDSRVQQIRKVGAQIGRNITHYA